MNSIWAVVGILGALYLLQYAFSDLSDTLLGLVMFAVVAGAGVYLYAGAHEDARSGKDDDVE